MFVCKNCNKAYESPVGFCGQCGGQVVEVVQPAFNDFSAAQSGQNYAQPSAPQQSYAPQQNYVPQQGYGSYPAPSGSKAPAILGMIFGIAALILSFVLLVAMVDMSDYYYVDIDDMLPGFMGLSVFTVPSMIVGLIMSFKANSGKGMAIAGKITSFISLGFYVIAFMIMMSA